MDEKFKNVQYFVTTHSNHFLDLINDYEYQDKISIYSVSILNGTKYVKQENDLSDTVYNLLGTRPSSILLANKTLWVEGVSDRMYIRHGLSLYQKEYNKKISEYYDYAFVEYSGSNLDHYFKDDSEQVDLNIDALSNLKNVFLLADDDGIYINGKNGNKRKRYDKAKKVLKNNFKTTDGIEIENYLSPNVLKAIFSSNIKIQELTDVADYKKESLPGFLSEKCGVEKYITNRDGSPRIADKKEFAKKAIEHQKKWEDLSEEMKTLIESIVAFIKE